MMTRAVRRALGALVILAAAIAIRPAAAQDTAPVIIIADINQILRDAKSAKDVQTQLDKAMMAYSRDVSQQENDLQKLRDDLERQRGTLASDAFAAKTREYQQRFDALDRNVQARRQAMQQSYNDAMVKIENAALQIISEIAAERKANMVLTRAAVLFSSPGLDVTSEVIKRIDTKLPTVAVVLPKDGAPVKPPSPAPAKPK